MRKIVRKARVNPALVYYYFDSKQGLMDAVLKRRFGPLRQEHLEVLHGFEGQAQGRPLPVEQILEAMLLPPLRLVAASAAKRQAVTRLLGRIITEPDAQTQKILRSQRAEVQAAFSTALQASLPHLGPAAIQWRMEFVWGALSFILCNPRTIEAATGGSGPALDPSQLLAEMVSFFSAGFRQTTSTAREGRSRRMSPSRPRTR